MKEVGEKRKKVVLPLGLVGLLAICVRSDRLPQISAALAIPTPNTQVSQPVTKEIAVIGVTPVAAPDVESGLPTPQVPAVVKMAETKTVESVRLPRGLMIATSSGKNLEVWRADPTYGGKLFANVDLVIMAQGGLTAAQEAGWIGREWDVQSACKDANYLLLAGGWNDALLGYRPVEMALGFELFYQRAVAACPKGVRVIVLGPPPMQGRERDYIENLFKLADWQRHFVESHGGIFIDLIKLLSAPNQLGELAEGLKKDDDHINGTAFMQISDEVARVLAAMGESGVGK